MATIFSDNFNRADGALEGSNGWVKVAGQINISGNKVVTSLGDSNYYNTVDLGGNYNYSVQAVNAAWDGEVSCRHNGSGNYYRLQYYQAGGVFDLYKVTNGTQADLFWVTGRTETYPVTLKIVCNGNHLEGWLNGTKLVEGDDSSFTTGQPGMRLYSAGSGCLDDYLVESLGSSVQLAKVGGIALASMAKYGGIAKASIKKVGGLTIQ